MGYRWIYSITVRTLLLVGGIVLVTLGIAVSYTHLTLPTTERV